MNAFVIARSKNEIRFNEKIPDRGNPLIRTKISCVQMYNSSRKRFLMSSYNSSRFYLRFLAVEEIKQQKVGYRINLI